MTTKGQAPAKQNGEKIAAPKRKEMPLSLPHSLAGIIYPCL